MDQPLLRRFVRPVLDTTTLPQRCSLLREQSSSWATGGRHCSHPTPQPAAESRTWQALVLGLDWPTVNQFPLSLTPDRFQLNQRNQVLQSPGSGLSPVPADLHLLRLRPPQSPRSPRFPPLHKLRPNHGPLQNKEAVVLLIDLNRRSEETPCPAPEALSPRQLNVLSPPQLNALLP